MFTDFLCRFLLLKSNKEDLIFANVFLFKTSLLLALTNFFSS